MKYAILNQNKDNVLIIIDNPIYRNYMQYDISNQVIQSYIDKDKKVIEFLDRIEQSNENIEILQKELDTYLLNTYKSKYFLIENNKIIEIKSFEDRLLSDYCIQYNEDDLFENLDVRIQTYLISDIKNKKLNELRYEYKKTKEKIIFKQKNLNVEQEWDLDVIITLLKEKLSDLLILKENQELLKNSVEFILDKKDNKIKFLLNIQNNQIPIDEEVLQQYNIIFTQHRAKYYQQLKDIEKLIENATNEVKNQSNFDKINKIDCTFAINNTFIL